MSFCGGLANVAAVIGVTGFSAANASVLGGSPEPSCEELAPGTTTLATIAATTSRNPHCRLEAPARLPRYSDGFPTLTRMTFLLRCRLFFPTFELSRNYY
jgi:hypothetical protein